MDDGDSAIPSGRGGHYGSCGRAESVSSGGSDANQLPLAVTQRKRWQQWRQMQEQR